MKNAFVMIIDLDKCIGCYSCQVNCRKEHLLSEGLEGIRVERREEGKAPGLRRRFFPSMCVQCEDAACADICAAGALSRDSRGIVLYDPEKCISCNMCQEVCDIGGIRSDGQRIFKCDLCADRLNDGELPSCADSCMGKAITVGAVGSSRISDIFSRYSRQLYVRRECSSCGARVYYIRRGENIFPELVRADIPVCSGECDSYYVGHEAVTGNKRYIHTVDMMCPAECSIRVLTENGKAVKIYGDPASLNNCGTLCSKGAAGLELVYSPKRIKTPLIRDGERGCGKWKEISWEAAAEMIAGKLTDIKRRFGAESVVLDCGDLTDHEPYMLLFRSFGTPNTFTHSAICDTNRRWGPRIFMGDERPLPDIQRPLLIRDKDGNLVSRKEHDIKLLINVGANPLVATRFSYMSRGIPDAKVNNGMYYIVIDPSFTDSAAKADKWLTIIPGTDAELLACMLKYILDKDDPGDKEHRYIDHGFLRNYTIGWESFRDDFLSQSRLIDRSVGYKNFSLEWGAEKTGISCEDIAELAHMMGIVKPAAIEIGMHGTAHHMDGDITSILSVVLCAVTGNIDRAGGLVFAGSVKPLLSFPSSRAGSDKLTERRVDGEVRMGSFNELHKDIYGDYPDAWKGTVSTIPDNIINGITLRSGTFKGYSYPIKAFINRTGNPLYTGGNPRKWREAFTASDNGVPLLELIVHIDTHLNETGRYADIVLPECSYLEKMGLSDQYTINPEISLRDRVISPLYESKPPFEIMRILAQALADAGDSDITASCIGSYGSEEELLDAQLSECPCFLNVGSPLPYPQYPEGALIKGVPNDPEVYLNGSLIRRGRKLTVSWLREHGGVAAWPMSYYRYRMCDKDELNGAFPKNVEKIFRFDMTAAEDNLFSDGERHRAFVCRENNSRFSDDIRRKYPFFLITGRTHQTGTATQICPSLSALETDANRKLTENRKDGGGAIPVFLMNKDDGKRHSIADREKIFLESPEGGRIRGIVYLSDGIASGVIKTVFGQGGRTMSSDRSNSMAAYTANVNELYEHNKLNRTTGMPAFGDIVVRIIKEQEDQDEH